MVLDGIVSNHTSSYQYRVYYVIRRLDLLITDIFPKLNNNKDCLISLTTGISI